jgi:hypothetical protein
MSGYLIVASIASHAQLVNIENMRMHTDSVRRAGNAFMSIAYNDNNKVQVFSMKGAVALQLKGKTYKDIFMMLGNTGINRVNAQNVVNAAFLHLRYNRVLSKVVRWEVFSQIQTNKLLDLGTRWLTGTGPRFKILNRKKIISYLGSLYMFEYEEVVGEFPEMNEDHRLSSYLTFTMHLPDIHAEFVSTAYLQPKLNDFDDHRVTLQSGLTFQLSKKFRWTTTFSFLYDSEPPNKIAGKAFSIDQGFRYDF